MALSELFPIADRPRIITLSRGRTKRNLAVVIHSISDISVQESC